MESKIVKLVGQMPGKYYDICANAIDPVWESQQRRKECLEAYQHRQKPYLKQMSLMDIDGDARQGTSYEDPD